MSDKDTTREATCETCPYWSRSADHVRYEQPDQREPGIEVSRVESERGTCRKLPPLYAWEADEGGFRTFPVTRFTDWCGSHPER